MPLPPVYRYIRRRTVCSVIRHVRRAPPSFLPSLFLSLSSFSRRSPLRNFPFRCHARATPPADRMETCRARLANRLAGCLASARGAMSLGFLLAAAASVTLANPLGTSTPTASTSAGILRGGVVQKNLGAVHQFLGVPYAKSPVGPNRFRPPQRLGKESATQVRNATTYGSSCSQPLHLKEVISPLLRTDPAPKVSEDCLFLNVFVPVEAKKKKPLPVMVWLPGEGFDYADASQYDGSDLALLGGVIVVTVNYRVSVFGFLSSLTHHAPGNVGLLDQRLALLWVKENAKSFGGDPSHITLFGRFSGAMSVAMHLTSPVSKGLFKRVILQSGVPTESWIIDSNPMNATRQLAELVGCPVDGDQAGMVSCLQQVPSETLLNNSLKVPQRWRPVIDGHFLKEDPLRSASAGRVSPVDVMLGVNSDEGSLCLLTLYAMKSPFYKEILKDTLKEKDMDSLVVNNVRDFLKISDPEIEKRVLHKYENDQSTIRRQYLKFCSSMYITSATVQMAELLAKLDNIRVFVYKFAHRPTFSIHPTFLQAAHGDDVLFSLGLAYQSPFASRDEVVLSSKIVKAFSNFAKHSDPNPIDDTVIWPAFNASKPMLLEFSTLMDESSIKDVDLKDARIWHDIRNLAQQKSLLSSSEINTAVEKDASLQGVDQDNAMPAAKRPDIYFAGPALSSQTTQYLLIGLVCTCFGLLICIVFVLITLSRLRSQVIFKEL